MIYFLEEKQLDPSQTNERPLIKIGRSKRPPKRVSQLSSGNARELVIVLSLRPPIGVSDAQLENYLHNRFERDRVRNDREWFYYSERIVRFIESQDDGVVYKLEKSWSWGRLFLWITLGAGFLCAASVAILTYINTF